VDQELIDNYTTGFEEVKETVKKYTPEYAGQLAGVDPALDPVSKIPQFKVCACRVRKADAPKNAATQARERSNTMKVRWTRRSIRFRISPSELEALMHGRPVREELAWPGGRWVAAIRPGGGETRLASEDDSLLVTLAEADRHRLAAPEAEGVYFETSAEPSLRFYIEKDFPCVHPRAAEALEPAGETFAPPADFAARKAEE